MTDAFQKFDGEKLRFDLMPPKALEAIVRVLTFGARKYAPGNWIKAPTWGRYYAALQRHMTAWWSGETNDPETGISHLAHAGCSLVFLMELERLGVSADDRPKEPTADAFALSQEDVNKTLAVLAAPQGEDLLSAATRVSRAYDDMERQLDKLREENRILEAELFSLRGSSGRRGDPG